MQEGLIVKGYGGFYFVQAGNSLYRCRGRGRLHRVGRGLLPGDLVRITPLEGMTGVIEEVKPRRNALVRPPVANVEQVIMVTPLSNPAPDLFLLDRLLVLAEAIQLDIIICFTKSDLASADESETPADLYRQIGYRVAVTSAKTGQGMPVLKSWLGEKISVMAGPSGAGKSTLLNALSPGLLLPTGEVSRKLQRGKHTTRHVELLPVAGGYVADTPGFSNLDLPPLQRRELAALFPELAGYTGECRYPDCLHRTEPDCAVKDALQREKIARSRYCHYLDFLEEVIARERIYQ